MSSSSLSSSSSAGFSQHSTSSIFTQSAPVLSYSSSALMPAHGTASSCSLPGREIQLIDRKFPFNDLPVDCIDNIFKYFSNEDYSAFSNVNRLFHNLIWNPSSIYMSRSYKSFLASILTNFYRKEKGLKEEEISPMMNLTFGTLIEEVRKGFIEELMTEIKQLNRESKGELTHDIFYSFNCKELLMLVKFRAVNSSFFEVQEKLIKMIRINTLQLQVKMNKSSDFKKTFKNLVLKAKKEQARLLPKLMQEKIQEKNRLMGKVHEQIQTLSNGNKAFALTYKNEKSKPVFKLKSPKIYEATSTNEARAQNIQGRMNQRGVRVLHLLPRGMQQPNLEPNDQRTSSCCEKVQTVAILAFAFFGFWCFITSIYGYCTDSNIRLL